MEESVMSPDRQEEESPVPNWLRSPTAMWAMTLTQLVVVFFAGFNVSRFAQLFHDDWWAIAVICSGGLLMKHGKDVAMAKIQQQGQAK